MCVQKSLTVLCRLNLKKCTFRVRADKFLGFYLTKKEIEVNPNKCEGVVKMSSLTSKKYVQKLNSMLITIKRFISKFAQLALPFYRLLRKEAKFEWTLECKKAFKSLKRVLATPPVLT